MLPLDRFFFSDVILVGAGGTGSYLADNIVSIVAKSNRYQPRIHLVDADVVEPKNLLRQDFFPGDEGQPKSFVLAKRLADRYRIPVRGYNQWADSFLRSFSVLSSIETIALIPVVLVISAVDNVTARKEIASFLGLCQFFAIWLDVGNGVNTGQLYVSTFWKRFSDLHPFPRIKDPISLNPNWEDPLVEDNGCEDLALIEEQTMQANRTAANIAANTTSLLYAGRPIFYHKIEFFLPTGQFVATNITEDVLY